MNIFVTRLNFRTKRETLKSAFEQFGEVVSTKIIRDRETRRSKGYGFVEMTNEADALKAIEALNESELDDRVIIVKPANSKTAPAGQSSEDVETKTSSDSFSAQESSATEETSEPDETPSEEKE